MRYNTGNPVLPDGSSDPRDLHDNSGNMDLLENGPAFSYPDRLGVMRKSRAGMENDFNQFLLSSGYEFIGDYDADGPLLIERPNQIFSKDGEYWRSSPSLSLPYTTVNDWGVDEANFVSIGDASLRQALATDAGAGMIGYSGRTLYDHAQERKSIADYGASTSLSDNLAAINEAIAACVRGESLYVPSGIFAVSATPPNSKGVRFYGPGQIVAPTPTSQINTYRYQYPIGINREYIDQFWQVMKVTARPIRIFAYGDSTVAGGFGFIDWEWFLQNLIPEMAAIKGIRNKINLTNKGVGGSNITSWDPVPDIDPLTGPDLIIVKYGLNDPYLPDALNAYESNLRNKLAAIRNDPDGNIFNVAILIVGPNAAWDEDDGVRNTRWFESLRSIHEAAAHDFQCAFFDPYALMADASKAANRWLDKINAFNNSALHPTNSGQSQIWGALFDWMVSESMVTRWKANGFRNLSNFYGFPKADFSFYPNNYQMGITWELADDASGWPMDGILMTDKSAEGPMRQVIMPLGVSGSTITRRADIAGNFFGAWYGQNVAQTLQNGWTNFGAPYPNAGAKITTEDVIHLDGLIRPGATAAGTLLFTLPENMRPVAQKIIMALADTGVIQLHVFTNGQVQLKTGTPVPGQWINLSGLSFTR